MVPIKKLIKKKKIKIRKTLIFLFQSQIFALFSVESRLWMSDEGLSCIFMSPKGPIGTQRAFKMGHFWVYENNMKHLFCESKLSEGSFEQSWGF